MKRMWKGIVPLCVLTVFLLVAMPISFAQPPEPGADGIGMKEFMNTLDKEQKASIKEITKQHREEMKDMREEMMSLVEELQQLIANDASQSDLDGKIEEISAMQTEMLKAEVETQLQIRNMLTDEQKQIFDQIPLHLGSFGPDKGPSPDKGPGPKDYNEDF